jgi:hypothetical protein
LGFLVWKQTIWQPCKTGANIGFFTPRSELHPYRRVKKPASDQGPMLWTLSLEIFIRVARWFVFKPKIQICVNFGGTCNGRWWNILWTMVHFTVIWYILWTFGIVCGNLVCFHVLVFCIKKNMATLIYIRRKNSVYLERQWCFQF